VKLSKEAVSELFEHRYDEVQSSWGAMIDQEEATGYLASCIQKGQEPGHIKSPSKRSWSWAQWEAASSSTMSMPEAASD